MRQEIFGMRRADGDWFALELEGQRRVLVFRSLAVAWRVRAKNAELMLFWPAPVDERALRECVIANDGHPVSFWLMDEDDPAADLRSGHPLEYLQLATLERIEPSPSQARSEGEADYAVERHAWGF